MQQELIYECPLGSKCEYAKDDKMYRCAWYTQLTGKHPQTGEQIDERSCAMAWLPMLLIENAKTNRGQTEALESFRNETVKGQNRFNQLFSQALHQSTKELPD